MAKSKPKPNQAGRATNDQSQAGERLQKVLAGAGLGSRRECETLILEGRVEIDHQVVTELGTRIDLDSQELRVDGENISSGRRQYFMVNKPTGVVATSRDPDGRPRVVDLAPPNAGRLFAVGRLDMSSEGLILLTNDGDLANALTHPRYGVEKIYHVQVAGQPTQRILAQLEKGIRLAEGWAQAQSVRVKKRRKTSTVLEMVLSEGRNREIRRLLARVGHKVQKLQRVAVGPVRLGDLPLGACRPLTVDEVKALRKVGRHSAPPARKSAASRPARRQTAPGGRGAKPGGRPPKKGTGKKTAQYGKQTGRAKGKGRRP